MAGGSSERHPHGAPEAAFAVSRRVWGTLMVAAVLMLALNNVLFGVLFRRAVSHTDDFLQVLMWSRDWLQGFNPYAPPDAVADYPPNAVVALAPLAAMSVTQAASAWTALHVVLAAAIGVMASRLGTSGRLALLFGGLVVALPPFRIVMQFSLASFAPGLAGFLMADRYPRLAGAAIGLSLMKPQIGGPFLLWAIAARRWRTVATAVALPLALFGVFVLRSMRPPHHVIAEWMQATVRHQNHRDLIAGETNLQPMLAWLPLSPLAVQALTALLLCIGLAVIAMRRRRDFDLRFLAAACLISLLSFRHLSYNLLLAIPALAFAVSRAGRAGRVIAALAFAVLIASPPSIWRHYVEPRVEATPLDPIALNAYRLVGLALFALALFWRDAPQKHGDTI